MTINFDDPQDSDIILAFNHWMHKWEKQYPSVKEKHARLLDFKNNILNQPFIPASAPLWNLLSQKADQPRSENFPVLRLDLFDDVIFDIDHHMNSSQQYHCDREKVTDILDAFQKWKRMWKKEYPSAEEAEARFQDFKNNILHQPFMPASEPLCDLLSQKADQPRTENFDVLRLDHCKMTLVHEAFQEWKKKWDKKYDSAKEEDTRFGDFTNNFHDEIKYSDDPPESKALWEVLNEDADRPRKEHLGHIRLDHNVDEAEYILPKAVKRGYIFPVKLMDGRIAVGWGTSPDHVSKVQSAMDIVMQHAKHAGSDDKYNKDDTKEEDLDDDATLKRPKIGYGGQKPGCCSDCGK